MNINTSMTHPMQPAKPVAPTPPPGGNIENRKPPMEPQKPSAPAESANVSANVSSTENVKSSGNLLDIYA